jgi:hypothetical protein
VGASVTANAGAHWLFDWIDEFEATDSKSARSRLADKGARDRLHQLATNHRPVDVSHVPLTGTVLAGFDLDVGRGACHNLSCRKSNFDTDMAALFHYFDYVVMRGPSAPVLAAWVEYVDGKHPRGEKFDLDLARALADDIGVMNYLRSTGIANYAIFVDLEEKCPCKRHFLEQAKDIGLTHLADPKFAKRIAADILRAGSLDVERIGPNRWGASLKGPNYSSNIRTWYTLKKPPTKRWLSEQLVKEALYGSVAEAAIAKELGTPLASIAQPEFMDLEQRGRKIAANEVALHLNIPVLSSIPTADLLRLRGEEYAHFERFRQVLTEAIQTTIDKSGSDSPAVIADEVWRNKIRPAVADIDRRIEASNKAIRRKAVAGLSIGAIAATFGALAGFPLIAAAGAAAAIGTPLPQIFKSIEDRQQVELADMYFLWKAKQSHKHA